MNHVSPHIRSLSRLSSFSLVFHSSSTQTAAVLQLWLSCQPQASPQQDTRLRHIGDQFLHQARMPTTSMFQVLAAAFGCLGVSGASYSCEDLVVAGGGTGGLYSAWRMVEAGLADPSRTCVFEQTQRLGESIATTPVTCPSIHRLLSPILPHELAAEQPGSTTQDHKHEPSKL